MWNTHTQKKSFVNNLQVTAYQLPIRHLQAVKCCYCCLFLFLHPSLPNPSENGHSTTIHIDGWSVKQNFDLSSKHFVFVHLSVFFVLSFFSVQIRHTVRHSKLCSFFKYLIWLLTSKDVNVVTPRNPNPSDTERTTPCFRFLLFFSLYK